jgi:CRISPR system Cascade subunit CasB
MAEEIKQIRTFMARRLSELLHSNQAHAVRADLAEMRRGVGKMPGEIPELWGAFLSDLPEELCGTAGRPSRAEWAIYTALTLFALHQQGNDPKTTPMHREGQTLGKAARRLAPMKDSDEFRRIERKFHIAAVSDDMEELAYRLRGLIQLMRTAQIPLDYVQLAADFYLYQIPECVSGVRLQWGREFYRTEKETVEEGKED